MIKQTLLFTFFLFFHSSTALANEKSVDVSIKIAGCKTFEDISDYITPLMSLIVSPANYNCKKITVRGIVGLTNRREFQFFPSHFYQKRAWLEYAVAVPIIVSQNESTTELNGSILLVTGIFTEGYANTKGSKSGKIMSAKYKRFM